MNNTRITPELTHIPEWDHGPEDRMQIDLLSELLPSDFTKISIQQLMYFRDRHLRIHFATSRQETQLNSL